MLPTMKIHTTEDDIKFILFEQPEIISDEIKQKNYWNFDNIFYAERILSKQQPGTVVDVGAGLGSFTIPIALRLGNKFKIHAFEPLTPIFMQLCTNALINLIDHVKPYNIALDKFNHSKESSILDVARSANHGSYSFVDEVNRIREIHSSEEKEMYEFRTLDSYDLQDVRLIKLSAPGMEREVLEGAKNTIISSNHPPIIFEAWEHDWYKDKLDDFYKCLSDMKYTHYHSWGSYVVAFKSFAQSDYFLNDDGSIDSDTGFFEQEKVHSTDETLADQKVYTPS